MQRLQTLHDPPGPDPRYGAQQRLAAAPQGWVAPARMGLSERRHYKRSGVRPGMRQHQSAIGESGSGAPFCAPIANEPLVIDDIQIERPRSPGHRRTVSRAPFQALEQTQQGPG